MKIYVLFKTDAWHSKASKELIGIFEEFKTAMTILKTSYNLTNDDETSLIHNYQTQGREENILIELVSINVLL